MSEISLTNFTELALDPRPHVSGEGLTVLYIHIISTI